MGGEEEVASTEGKELALVDSEPEEDLRGISFSVSGAFCDAASSAAHAAWQEARGHALSLRGHVVVTKEGVNGTMEGKADDCRAYVTELRDAFAGHDVDVKAVRPSPLLYSLLDVVYCIDGDEVLIEQEETPPSEEIVDWHPPLAFPPRVQVEVLA